MKVAVAMSGGVDSSTVAGMLVEQGHDVVGLAMKTHGLEPQANRACCTPDDMRDARRVADQLHIPFYVINYEEVFKTEIIDPFVAAYQAGRTPNPCVECNDKVKFRPLLQRAEILGAEVLATGHYARIERRQGRSVLLRGCDPAKDQSYFLYRLSAAQLGRLWFPLGALNKGQVRAHARRMGIQVAEKRESQEICFVGKGGYKSLVDARGGTRGGAIVDGEGNQLGQHDGVHRFTLGQRRGLRIAASRPLYVTNIDAACGTVTVGDRNALLSDRAMISAPRWTWDRPSVGDEVLLQQRYRDVPHPAVVTAIDAGGVTFRLRAPQARGAPGQAAVVFSGDMVLGGGTIESPFQASQHGG